MVRETFRRLWVMSFLVGSAAALFGCASTPVEPVSKPPVLYPQQAQVHVQQGAIAYEQGDISAAIEAWNLAVELNPADAVIVNNLALLLKQKNRFDEAAALLENGLKLSPEVAELHYNLAVISELYLLDLDRALVHYQRYQGLSADEDKKVTGWIADLERRLD
ncbi:MULTISPECIES: tetratricopeptide repeat protein [Marinobacter]|uniref:Tetratricopeptide repeat protein n=1 Tax=Marinobacter xiaoshiensis TaxID=3073652 RepID=A0ABU2HH81_9GAMM|nr:MULTISPECIES: tetratricopeptide repeat protein [unclassified Marinobacter]MDS1310420.1 tetratricopeptide repeat protein [Marinobacter sp. F60267]